VVLIKQLRVDADTYDQSWLRWWCGLSVALVGGTRGDGAGIYCRIAGGHVITD
jgi:hypothetical protein